MIVVMRVGRVVQGSVLMGGVVVLGRVVVVFVRVGVEEGGHTVLGDLRVLVSVVERDRLYKFTVGLRIERCDEQ